MAEWIDLRSDTVTRPSKEMLETMMNAPLGDDVFGEDPSVAELEAYAAGLFGKEAGLFCPSGTMTNQIAIKVHTQPGDEVICDVNSHIYNYEGGGLAVNAGVQAKLLKGEEGRLSAALIEPAIHDDLDWLTRTSLVSLENTVNRAGGSYYTVAQTEPVRALCFTSMGPVFLMRWQRRVTALRRRDAVFIRYPSACQKAWVLRPVLCCWETVTL
jgi:threonine aldolase